MKKESRINNHNIEYKSLEGGRLCGFHTDKIKGRRKNFRFVEIVKIRKLPRSTSLNKIRSVSVTTEKEGTIYKWVKIDKLVDRMLGKYLKS